MGRLRLNRGGQIENFCFDPESKKLGSSQGPLKPLDYNAGFRECARVKASLAPGTLLEHNVPGHLD